MFSNFYYEMNKFLKRIKSDIKFKSEEDIELEENINHLDDKILYIEKVNSKLNEILESLFDKNDEVIFCVNIYREMNYKKYFIYDLRLKKYIRKKVNLNMVSSPFDEDCIIENYYCELKYKDLKIKKLASDLSKKDMGYKISGIETAFLINKNTKVGVGLYDDRYIYIEK